jgi:hypothetical protein
VLLAVGDEKLRSGREVPVRCGVEMLERVEHGGAAFDAGQ